MIIDLDAQSWNLGVIHGAGNVPRPRWSLGPSKGQGTDSYSYCSGRIEGEAYRQGFSVSMQVVEIIAQAARGRIWGMPDPVETNIPESLQSAN